MGSGVQNGDSKITRLKKVKTLPTEIMILPIKHREAHKVCPALIRSMLYMQEET